MSLWARGRAALRAEVERWLEAEPPGDALAGGGLPPGLGTMQRLATSHRLASLLPYEAFDPSTGLFHNDDAVGFVLEAAPAAGLSEAQLRALGGLFTQVLPAGTALQVTLYASPDVQPLLERWAAARQHPADVAAAETFRFLAAERLEFLRPHGWRSLLADQAMLLRDFRLLVSVLRPGAALGGVERDGLLRMRDAVRGVLQAAGLPSWPCDASAFLGLMDGLLNPRRAARVVPRWDEGRRLCDQMVDADTVLLVGRDGLALRHGDFQLDVRPFTVRQFPQAWAGWGMGDLAGDLLANTLRIPCPFLYTLTVQVPDVGAEQQRARFRAARATQMADSPMGRFLPAWQERKRDWDTVTRMLDGGHRLLRASFQAVLLAPHGEGEAAERSLHALFESRGWWLQKERYTALPAFLSALPLAAGPSTLREMETLGRLHTFLTWSCVNTAPVAAEWKGSRSPLLLLVGRRGQVMTVDPFDNEKGNFNIAVAAASGAGKSFFTQEVVLSLLGTGGRVWVIDSGRSYERLCRLLGGTYLAFGPDADINLNPFTAVRALRDSMPMLKELLAHMASPAAPLDSLETARLEEVLATVWTAKGREATVTDVAHALAEHPDAAARRLGVMLYPYTRDGTHARYFDGPATIDLDHPFVVLELGDLDARPDLQTVVLLMLMLRITETMYLGDRAQRKLCIVDEAWRLLGQGGAGRFVEQGYRTARKFGGAFMTITQGIDDYYRSSTSKAALDNADWVFLLRQKAESLKAAAASDRLVIDDALRTLLESVDTRQGKYSELAILGPAGTAIGRLVVDPLTEKLYSTRAEDYAEIERQLRAGSSLFEVLCRLAGLTDGIE
ncbi:MAG: type IV secretion system protein TraC [Chromatiales bacterium]|nr:type IV secretion system protein TraC [Chromatiales bacterium]